MRFYYKEDIFKLVKGRSIVLFGSGNVAQKTKSLVDNNVKFIADNTKNLWGTTYKNVKIQNPNKLKKNKKKYFVIICTTSFEEVSSQLINFGYEDEQDFILSPILNDLRIIEEFSNLNKDLIFSSGSPPNKNKDFGGGIYHIKLRNNKWSCTKKISGNCHGLIKHKNNFIAVDTDLGIFEFDKNFKILRSQKLPSFSRAHGVSYSNKENEFYVVCTYLDAVLVLNEKFKIKHKIQISNKVGSLNTATHHCNDCEYNDGYLYVSMFSETGNWKKDVFDGCILEIDLKRKKINKPIKTDLWMPHNPKIINGSFYVNDSLRGNLLGNNFNIVGSFPAFTRGLHHDGRFFYIGQSRNRNYSKNIGLTNNISIDAGIIIFDEKTKVSRFLQVSPKISEIHSIVDLNSD